MGPVAPVKPVAPVAPVRVVAEIQDKFPDPLVDSRLPEDPPVMITLLFDPKLATPLTVRPVNVPTLVMLGCAAVVSVVAA